MGFIKQLVREIQADDLTGGAAELAYRFLFALFPFFLFLAAFSGFVTDWLNVSDPTDRLITEIGDRLPDDAASILDTQLRGVLESSRGGLLSISAVLALWSASSATKTVMKWLNRAYNVEESRPFVRKQAVGLGLTLLGAVGFIGGALLLVGGQLAGDQVAEALGLSGAWGTVVSLARIPLVLVLLMGAMAVVYWLTPNNDLSFKWITPGAVLFVVAWLAATIGFAFYVANFANYQATYGTIGGVIILMLWLYITALILLVGGKINALIEERAENDNATSADGEVGAEDTPLEGAAAGTHPSRGNASRPRHRVAAGESEKAPGRSTETREPAGEGGIGRTAAVAAASALLGAVAMRSATNVLRDGHNGNGKSH